MITRYSFSTVWVLDQDSAKTFYTEKLGFEVRSDQTMDGLRWLTVGPKQQPDFQLILAKPGPPMNDDEAAKSIRSLVARGASPVARRASPVARGFSRASIAFLHARAYGRRWPKSCATRRTRGTQAIGAYRPRAVGHFRVRARQLTPPAQHGRRTWNPSLSVPIGAASAFAWSSPPPYFSPSSPSGEPPRSS